MGSTLKVRVLGKTTLIDKIKVILEKSSGDEGQTDASEGAKKEVALNAYARRGATASFSVAAATEKQLASSNHLEQPWPVLNPVWRG